MFTYYGEHLGRSEVLEARPAVILIRPALRILACWEDLTFHRLLESIGLVLFKRMQVVETTNEEEVGDLLDHLQRIRDPAGPE
jgi:hypothetical protein